MIGPCALSCCLSGCEPPVKLVERLHEPGNPMTRSTRYETIELMTKCPELRKIKELLAESRAVVPLMAPKRLGRPTSLELTTKRRLELTATIIRQPEASANSASGCGLNSTDRSASNSRAEQKRFSIVKLDETCGGQHKAQDTDAHELCHEQQAQLDLGLQANTNFRSNIACERLSCQSFVLFQAQELAEATGRIQLANANYNRNYSQLDHDQACSCAADCCKRCAKSENDVAFNDGHHIGDDSDYQEVHAAGHNQDTSTTITMSRRTRKGQTGCSYNSDENQPLVESSCNQRRKAQQQGQLVSLKLFRRFQGLMMLPNGHRWPPSGTSGRCHGKRVNTQPFLVMISYSHLEAQSYARQLKEALERLQVSVYLDLAEIRSGSDWQDSLNEAILSCQAFVPLVTPSYGETLWTARELKLADLLAKLIIPINFGQAWPPRSLAIQFATVQYLNWRERHADRFGVRLRRNGRVDTPRWPSACVEGVARQIRLTLADRICRDPKLVSLAGSLCKLELTQRTELCLEEAASASESAPSWSRGAGSRATPIAEPSSGQPAPPPALICPPPLAEGSSCASSASCSTAGSSANSSDCPSPDDRLPVGPATGGKFTFGPGATSAAAAAKQRQLARRHRQLLSSSSSSGFFSSTPSDPEFEQRQQQEQQLQEQQRQQLRTPGCSPLITDYGSISGSPQATLISNAAHQDAADDELTNGDESSPSLSERRKAKSSSLKSRAKRWLVSRVKRKVSVSGDQSPGGHESPGNSPMRASSGGHPPLLSAVR